MENLSDPAAERGVLAGVCAYGSDAWLDASDLVGVNAYTIDSNQTLWKCLGRIVAEDPRPSVDYPSIMSAAHAMGLGSVMDKDVEREHLRAIINTPVKRESVRRLAARVAKLEIARNLWRRVDQAHHNLSLLTGDESIEQVLSAAENPIFEFTASLQNTDGRATKPMGEGAMEYLCHLMDNPRDQVGVSTGLKRYDAVIGGGLRPNGLDVIAARPKCGKSAMADHVALHVAGNLGVPVLNLDTEMSWEEHLHRVAANLAGLPINDIERGICGRNEAQRRQVEESAIELKKMPYSYRCITGEHFEETLAHMRRWVLRNVGLGPDGKANKCVIIYDYLKLMTADALMKGDVSEWQMLGFICTALKNFACRYGVAILAFAQLNRLGDIAASDRIKWFCTSFSRYKWKDGTSMEDVGRGRYTHDLEVEMTRHGPGMRDGDFINIKANYAIARIEEGPLDSELKNGLATGQPRGFVANAEADTSEIAL